MTPDDARELRHELRTPVNHLIGYAELLLEEDDLDPATVTQLERTRALARSVLELVPGLLADDGSSPDESVRALREQVGELETTTLALTAAPGTLPPDDIARLASAVTRLSELADRLSSGTVFVARSTGAAAEPQAGRLETILAVDDDEANRDVLGRRLQKLGYGIVEARDGIEALERLARPGIDLVLLDVMMPRLDGLLCWNGIVPTPASDTSRSS